MWTKLGSREDFRSTLSKVKEAFVCKQYFKRKGLAMNMRISVSHVGMHVTLTFMLLFLLICASTVCAGELLPKVVKHELSANGMVSDPAALMRHCAPRVAMVTMSKLIYVESKWNAYALNINYRGWHLAHQPRNKEEAVVTLRYLLATYSGIKAFSVDAGVGQINSRNFARLGIADEQLFEPCENVRAAETILVDCYVRAQPMRRGEQAALASAISCYNTGTFFRGFEHGYVRKVYRAPVLRHRR